MSTLSNRSIRCVAVVLALAATATAVDAQTTGWTPAPRAGSDSLVLPRIPAAVSPPAPQPSLFQPFVDVAGDLRRFPSKGSLEWLTIGVVAAALSYPADERVTSNVANLKGQLGESFEGGAVLGGTPLQLGTAFATYAIGRAVDSPRAVRVGADLIRAQVLAELLTTGVKQSFRRSRPDGGNFSFSSGHTAVTVASATVLQRHFGWKVGLPAYAVAGYVAASRVEMKRHYLSDVVFGAALGLAAGRTVTVGKRIIVEPLIVGGGGGASFTWTGKP